MVVTRWTLGAVVVLLAAGANMACRDETPEPAPVLERAEEPASAEAVQRAEPASSMDRDKDRAVATLTAESGSELKGEAFFVEEEDGAIAFGINVENVVPGSHAVHIHETGDCSAQDASSADGHWNPTGENHGKWGDGSFHLGDIGNIEVGADGQGTLSLSTDLWTLDGAPHALLGKAVVVHAGADDFTTQPDGNAGERIGCGVIERKTQT